MRHLRHIVLAVVAVMAVFSCGRKGRVISRSDMAGIYADMLLADQWARGDYKYRRQIDTTLFYEPIFESYGYTTDDYMKSVEYYLRDPERFSRILKKTAKVLEKKSDALKKIVDAKELERIHLEELRPRLLKILSKFSGDSVWVGAAAVQVDSNLEISVIRFPSDTFFKGPEVIVISDTLAVTDSVSVVSDSLAVVVDSLPSADSSKVKQIKLDSLDRGGKELVSGNGLELVKR